MTNINAILAAIREALAQPALYGAARRVTYQEEALALACKPANMAALLAHIDAQAERNRILGESVDAITTQAEKAEALLDAAKSQIDHMRRERETLALESLRAGAQLTSVSIAIGSNRWLDPPDGGDVSLAEQVTRMREALEAAEAASGRTRCGIAARKGE